MAFNFDWIATNKGDYPFSFWRSSFKIFAAFDLARLLVEVDNVLAASETLLFLLLAIGLTPLIVLRSFFHLEINFPISMTRKDKVMQKK